MTAIRLMHESLMRGEFATGVVYVEPDKEDFLQTLNLVSGPLAALPQDRVRPSKAVLDQLMDSLR
jgi:2-oxoglutarate ferredoxin oxidoreductase subunit beta